MGIRPLTNCSGRATARELLHQALGAGHAAATYSDTAGIFVALIIWEYSGKGVTCLNVNEGTAGSHDGHAAATCSNRTGSFTCTACA